MSDIGKSFLYLSAADVAACAIDLADVEAAIETMFAAKGRGETVSYPKVGMGISPGLVFLNMGGGLSSAGFAGLKWVGVRGADRPEALPHFTGLMVLNEAETGAPVMVAEATWITGVRTAAISAVAARHLARPESASIGFIACGFQARAHLAALCVGFPIRAVRAYSRRRETAEAFAQQARAQGLDAAAVAAPREAIEGLDLVVTSIPLLPQVAPFLDAAWLAPGSFASMVDLGFSWIRDGLETLDRVVTDDLVPGGGEGLAYPAPFDGEIADLVGGTIPGRKTADQRTALVFGGLGLSDVAVGGLLYERAREKGVGRVLPL